MAEISVYVEGFTKYRENIISTAITLRVEKMRLLFLKAIHTKLESTSRARGEVSKL